MKVLSKGNFFSDDIIFWKFKTPRKTKIMIEQMTKYILLYEQSFCFHFKC